MSLKLEDFYQPYGDTALPAFAAVAGMAPNTGEPGAVVRRSLWRMLASLAAREPLRRKGRGAPKPEAIEKILRREIPRHVRLPADEAERIARELGTWLRAESRQFPFGSIQVDKKGIPRFTSTAGHPEGERSRAASVWDRNAGTVLAPVAAGPSPAPKSKTKTKRKRSR